MIFTACDSTPRFTVEGEITEAGGKTLYLEASQIQSVTVLDSVKLKDKGTFKFKQPKPDNPEFYRLRVDNKVINFAVDGDETITINAPYNGFTTTYTVKNSPNSEKIKELVLKQINLQDNVNALVKSAREGKITNEEFQEKVTEVVNSHKDDIKMNYIYAAPNTTPAYFALFQTVNDFLIFDPMNNKDDLRCFQAVATSMDTFYPHSPRSKNLKNLTLKGLRNNRPAQETTLEIPEDKIVETGIIDINLRDLKGNSRRLSDLKGKVVLLDFTVYQSAVSTPHNFLLNELYEKYASKGLEIYQVSFDADEHFWKTVADNLPWISVRDPNGIYSSIASVYNLQELPAYFLINRKNEMVLRGEDVKNLENEVKSLL